MIVQTWEGRLTALPRANSRQDRRNRRIYDHWDQDTCAHDWLVRMRNLYGRDAIQARLMKSTDVPFDELDRIRMLREDKIRVINSDNPSTYNRPDGCVVYQIYVKGHPEEGVYTGGTNEATLPTAYGGCGEQWLHPSKTDETSLQA